MSKNALMCIYILRICTYWRERNRIGTIIHIQVRVNRNGTCIKTASLRTLAAHEPCTKDTANLVHFGSNVCTGSVPCTTRGEPGLKKVKFLNCMPHTYIKEMKTLMKVMTRAKKQIFWSKLNLSYQVIIINNWNSICFSFNNISPWSLAVTQKIQGSLRKELEALISHRWTPIYACLVPFFICSLFFCLSLSRLLINLISLPHLVIYLFSLSFSYLLFFFVIHYFSLPLHFPRFSSTLHTLFLPIFYFFSSFIYSSLSYLPFYLSL